MRETQALITQLTSLTADIVCVHLKLAPFINYQPGQYLQFKHQAQFLSYSIANAAQPGELLELHVRDNSLMRIISFLQQKMSKQQPLTLRLPLGLCHVGCLHADKPILLIAGGTGFAPIKAMLEYLIHKPLVDVTLIWSVRAVDDLYANELVMNWAKKYDFLNYCPMITGAHPERLVDKILAKKDLMTHQVVIAGPFEMAYELRRHLVGAGVGAAYIHADAFEFITQGEK